MANKKRFSVWVNEERRPFKEARWAKEGYVEAENAAAALKAAKREFGQRARVATGNSHP